MKELKLKKLLFFLTFFIVFFFLSETRAAFTFRKSLSRGMSGTEVTELQRRLSLFPDIYREQTVTGYFGVKTEQAVKRFQKKYNLEQTGALGPMTRALLNARAEVVLPSATRKNVLQSPPVSPASQQAIAQKSPQALLNQAAPQQAVTLKTPGYAELVAVADGVAASLSRDDVMQVIDVQNPQSPSVIQTIDTPAFAEAVYQKNGYLYIADSRELQIWNNSGMQVGSYSLQDFWTSALTIDNGYAYLASGKEMMIVDVHAPQSIKKIAKISLTGQAPSHVVVNNGYAYVVETLGGLNVVDVRNPTAPSIIKVIPFESHTTGFRVKGNYAYLARVSSITSTAQGYSQTSLFEVIDISQPNVAYVVASVEIPTNVTGLDVDGNYAYVIGSYPHRLTPIDVGDPLHPAIIKASESIVGNADLQGIAVAGGFAFIADGGVGLRIVDISNVANPRHVKDVDLQGRAFSVYKGGNKLYVGVEQKYFNLADVKNPQAPTSTYSEPFTASYKYTSLVIDKKRAYFNGGGAKIYDITDPRYPRRLEAKSAEVDSIQIQGDFLYSTIGEIGLLIYDVSDLSAFTQVSRTPFPMGIPRNLSVDGQWAVGISNSPYSINVFDVSDPRKPIARQSYLYQKYPNQITVKNGYAYVARAEDGVDVLRINPDGTLALVKNLPTKGYAHRVVAEGDRAFIVRDGADIYDVRDPRNPVFLVHISNKGEANHVAVYNEHLYIADGYAGITIVKMP